MYSLAYFHLLFLNAAIVDLYSVDCSILQLSSRYFILVQLLNLNSSFSFGFDQNVNLISLLVREEGVLDNMNAVISSLTALMVAMKSTVVRRCFVGRIHRLLLELMFFDFQIDLVEILTCTSVAMVTVSLLPSFVMVTMIVATGLMS